MVERRIFPRIDSDWPLFLMTETGQKRIGNVKNISLSGAVLHFTKEYALNQEKNNFILKLINPQMEPSEVTISGLREWSKVEKYEVSLGLSLEELQKDKRGIFIRFLSRSDKLQVEAFLIEVE
jgi:hypothetical protein